jgi:hypothetical protein
MNDAKVIQYRTRKSLSPLCTLVTFVVKKSNARVIRSIESEAIGQAGMIHSGGRSAV